MGFAACIPLPLLPGSCLSQAPDSLCQDLCHPFLVCGNNKEKYGKLDGDVRVLLCTSGCNVVTFYQNLPKVLKYASSGGVKGGV